MILKTIVKEIKTCGKTRYRISQDTGVREEILCRILKGGGCKDKTADVLLKYFGYKLTKEPPK